VPSTGFENLRSAQALFLSTVQRDSEAAVGATCRTLWESAASRSDGLATRLSGGAWVSRRWTPPRVLGLLILAFNGACVPSTPLSALGTLRGLLLLLPRSLQTYWVRDVSLHL
jgi:hypothetical protein